MGEHARSLIGVPFVYGGRGPGSYDCWGLAREMYRRVHGVLVPDFTSPTEQGPQAATGAVQMLNPMWEEVRVRPGSIAAIRIGHLVSHCGFMLDANTMIHAWEKTGGVSIVRMDEWERRVAGFYHYAG